MSLMGGGGAGIMMLLKRWAKWGSVHLANNIAYNSIMQYCVLTVAVI